MKLRRNVGGFGPFTSGEGGNGPEAITDTAECFVVPQRHWCAGGSSELGQRSSRQHEGALLFPLAAVAGRGGGLYPPEATRSVASVLMRARGKHCTSTCTCTCTCICNGTCTCMCMCTCTYNTCTCKYTCTCICSSTSTGMCGGPPPPLVFASTGMCLCTWACTCTCMCLCTSTCGHACVPAPARTLAPAHAPA